MAFVYRPSAFMLPDSHYNKDKADRAVAFIEHLCHTKGKWAGQPFLLLPWQEQIVRDLFGIVKENGKRQFLTAYIEVPKKNGKSELAAAIALYLLYADNEPSAEVYGAACDRNQASIVFDVARQMVEMSPALMRRSKIRTAGKRIINYRNAGFYQVLSAETGTKHGLNVSGLVFDEIHAQPNRKLYDVLTKGSGDAREQPLFFIITTAGNDKNSICYELHIKALHLMAGRKKDYTFYPVVYGLEGEADWTDEANWYKANPSLGHTIQIDRVREAYQNAIENPAEENVFKQLRLNIWTSASIRWIPEQVYDKGNLPIDLDSLRGRMCYGGLDLSSTSDITALVLAFPPRTEEENISCCHSSGCRKTHWNFAADVTMSSTTSGRSRASSRRRKETSSITALSRSSSNAWGKRTTSGKSPMTAGTPPRWCRILRTWALPWCLSARGSRICRRRRRSCSSF